MSSKITAKIDLKRKMQEELKIGENTINWEKDIIDFERINGVVAMEILGASDPLLLGVNDRVRIDQAQRHPSSFFFFFVSSVCDCANF